MEAFIMIFLVILFVGAWIYSSMKDSEHESEMYAQGFKKVKGCPKCESEEISPFVQQTFHDAKTKTRYSANLNPLHPLTVVNKKEKVVNPAHTTSETMWQCQKCGHIFKTPRNMFVKR